MKITVERDALKEALACVINRTKNRLSIPILSHVLVRTKDKQVELTGHDLDSSSQVTLPADIDAPGEVAIPGDRLHRLVAGLASGSQVSIMADDKVAKLRIGRASYDFSLLPPTDFPNPLAAKEPVTIEMTAKQVSALFATPSLCICQEHSRPYLNGIYLHKKGKHLCGCATDGHTLALTSIEFGCADFAGVIVPEKACDEFVRLTGDHDAVFEISPSVIAIQVGNRRFASKLIDGTFPDYQRVIPQPNAPAMTFDCKELGDALVRLEAAHDPEKQGDAVRIVWDARGEGVTASIRCGEAIGEERVEFDGDERDAGEIGIQCSYLRRMIDVTGGKLIKFYISGPGDSVRVENPALDDLVAVVMPCRW